MSVHILWLWALHAPLLSPTKRQHGPLHCVNQRIHSANNDLFPKYKREKEEEEIDSACLMCTNQNLDFQVGTTKRRALGEFDLLVQVQYCGICHTDLHFANNDLGNTKYPIVLGHEIVGICTKIGSKVNNSKFRVGDKIGVGFIVDSCLECDLCAKGQEQYCRKGPTITYGSQDIHGRSPVGSSDVTFGGFSSRIVVHERFAVRIPDSYPLKSAAPLMCAGITVYTPLKKCEVGTKSRVGIIGLGGLGTMVSC